MKPNKTKNQWEFDNFIIISQNDSFLIAEPFMFTPRIVYLPNEIVDNFNSLWIFADETKEYFKSYEDALKYAVKNKLNEKQN